MDSSKGRIRIIAGEFRGRRIAVPHREDLRPTPDRVRETLFNWLGQRLTGLRCLDLFAGSGALGFEAASRGAARVVMVENDPVALAGLRKTREILGSAAVQVLRADAYRYVREAKEDFDVVFLDPPFRQNALPQLLEALAAKLSPGARVYVESDEPVPAQDGWHEARRARAGGVSYQLLERR